MSTIGFIGLGHMGGPMTANLIKAGHTVTGYDLVPEAMDAAAEHGVITADSAAETVAGADVVFTMLPRGEHSLAAYGGDDGIFAHASTDTLLIDSSTIDVESCQKVHDDARARGFRLVDAPVSGGISGAEAGTLTFMVGGADDHVAEAKPYIEPMAGNIIATGGDTTGQAAKICNNLMLFINMASTCEGAVLADRLGLDKQTFWDIASVSSGDSWPLRTWYPIPGVVDTAASNRDFDPTFTTELANKDIGLAIAAAETTGTPLELGEYVQSMFQKITDQGLGGKDCSAIVKLIDGSMGEN